MNRYTTYRLYEHPEQMPREVMRNYVSAMLAFWRSVQGRTTCWEGKARCNIHHLEQLEAMEGSE